tara:strand:- start:13577 stop:15880 length:2304 start_codon:yes stop_codon:yes gene_type:complete
MSYDNEKKRFGKEHIYIVEIDADYCANTFGVAPCTATGSGDAKCYNTLENCQDIPNYNKTTKTYRFCEARSPHPIGLDAIPLLKNVSISPSVIDVGGGLGVRASVSCSFTDAPHSDIGIDKYVNERTYIASDRGTFWTKWRARNPNYQFRSMRVLSGYLVNGVFDAANFQTRYYVVESVNATSGACSITGKDPLKLTSKNKAQAPRASKGLLSLPISSGATSLTLTPSGIGNQEYPASGKVLIKSEVMNFTRANDVLTLTRGQNNTLATDHAINSTVQICLDYSGKSLDFIVKDLLVNYAEIDASFIPDSAWFAEVDTYLSGLLSGIIVKPFDVFKLLQELAEAMPHYLWWDERNALIQLTALKAPPIGADVIDMDGNIVENSFSTKDKTEMRLSTVFVNFGQFDPTKKLDEPGNYEQTYARIDTDSISKYGSNEIRTINSRWISNNNKAAALQLAALIGRRFSNIPRQIGFSLEAKDSDVWIGQTREVNHRDIVDKSGAPVDTLFQILSAKEGELYKYSALEFDYGEALPEDEGGGVPGVDLIIISIDATNINLRTIYNSLFPAPDGSTQVKFIVEGGVKIGSTSTGTYSLDTGSWPAGAEITLQTDVSSLSVGKGGKGSQATAEDAENGGPAIILNHDLELVNNGVIGGGGGGGTRGVLNHAAGGGGAGYEVGLNGGLNVDPPGTTTSNIIAEDGTNELGGNGGRIDWEVDSEPFFDVGGNGGDLGQAGVSQGGKTAGVAGIAINRNGFTLTETETGDIRGSIIG